MRPLLTASDILDTTPQDHNAQEVQGCLSHLIKEIEDRKINGKRIWSRVQWKWQGDLISKEFFQAVRERPQLATITSLKDEAGYVTQD